MDKDNHMSNEIRAKCRKCRTIFVAVRLPIDVRDLEKGIKGAACPNCDESAWSASLSMLEASSHAAKNDNELPQPDPTTAY